MHQNAQQGDCSRIALHGTVALRSSVMWSLQAPLQHAPCFACLRATASPCQVPVPGTIWQQHEEVQNKYRCKTNSQKDTTPGAPACGSGSEYNLASLPDCP